MGDNVLVAMENILATLLMLQINFDPKLVLRDIPFWKCSRDGVNYIEK